SKLRIYGEERLAAQSIACRRSVKSSAACGWRAAFEATVSTTQLERVNSSHAALSMVIKHGACSHPMNWYGQEVCLAVHWRKAFIGARGRWSASSRKLPTIVPVRARARMRALPRVGNLADQFPDCVRLSILSSRHKGQTLEQMHVLF